MLSVKETEEGVIFSIRVIPRSSRCECVGIQDDALKIKITAPPVEGKANIECIGLLSSILGVKKAQVAIIKGHKSKNKTVSVAGVTKENVIAIIPTS